MFAILLVHLVIGTALVVGGDRIGRRGFAVAAIAPVIALIWLASRWSDVVDGTPTDETIGWVDGLGIDLDFRLDGLGLVMVSLVSGIGLLVCLYALGYFSDKPGVGRLSGLMTLFAGSMLGVVLTDHLIALFVFWELTSVTSYLLIGNDDRKAEARAAARQAILVTGAGGLVLLAGLVLIGQAGGTFRLSELVAAVPSGGIVSAGLLCVLIGAFTKSAQLPFSLWLPGAMVAPTPISAYLHAATMVKAGVYLIARMSPLFAEMGAWRPVVLVIGSATMVVGGWAALRQHDLKLLLAHGTVSQLGFLVALVGAGDKALAQAGIVLLLAHGAFKGTLFMVVGIIDHQAGTRDVRRLHDLGPGWNGVKIIAVIGAASMAGVPPLIGFIAKEKALLAGAEADITGALFVTAAFVVGSMFTVAYSGRYVLGVLGRLYEQPSKDLGGPVVTSAPAPSWSFVAPAIVLTIMTVVTGLVPGVLDGMVKAATLGLYPTKEPESLKLWAGWNVAATLSAIVLTVGGLIAWQSRAVEGFLTRLRAMGLRSPDGDGVFNATVDGTTTFGRRVTAIVQNGSLPLYLAVILLVAALAPLGPAITELGEFGDWVETPVHVPLAALIVVSAVTATLLRRRIAAALLLGAVGYGMAGLYVVQGAPDLALTQFAIETLATVMFVLVLRFLPREITHRAPAITVPFRVVVSALVGASVFVVALVASGARSTVQAPDISREMLARSLPDGKGSNVVNVILVDFRGLDTLGEITVLLVAALGAVALARSARQQVAMGAGSLDKLARLPIVDASVRLLYASILVLSLYLLFAGHNQPGGGFVGGLTAGAAVSLRYIAGGVPAVRNSLPVPPWTVLGSGLALAVGTALTPVLLGGNLLEHAEIEMSLPVLGTLKATSALPFDIGVYAVVLGLVLMAYEAFGEDVETDEGERSASAPTVVA